MEDCEIKIIWRKQRRTTGLCWFLNVFAVCCRSTHLRFVIIRVIDFNKESRSNHPRYPLPDEARWPFTSVKWIKVQMSITHRPTIKGYTA